MKLLFEWDASKARANRKKHAVSFEDATTVFGDIRAITVKSIVSSDEARFVTIGKASTGALIIVVVHTDRNDRIRIISARPASKAERRQYLG